jgi:hypothetical protein
MSSSPQHASLASSLLYDRTFEDGEVFISVQIDERYRTRIALQGRGTMEGVLAFLAMLDECIAELGTDHPVEALIDLLALDGAPLRAQVRIGRWLFAKRHLVKSVAVFGGKTWEMKLARAVMAMARIHNVGFFKAEPEAVRYLQW